MRNGWILGLVVLTIASADIQASPIRVPRPWELKRLNADLQGCVVDFTNNHGEDRRFYSQALCKKRDMYVYLPPGYDGVKQFPIIVWLHGYSQDEKDTKKLAKMIDQRIVAGTFPPTIMAVPDGTFNGTPTLTNSGSFFLNGVKGRYEDLLMQDVWQILVDNFAIRPEREAHVMAGASMGGTSAFNIAFKHKDKFGVVVGIMPLLNLLYADCHGDKRGPFDPNCMGEITKFRPHEIAGRLLVVIPIRNGRTLRPILGSNEQIEARLPQENPFHMLDLYDIKPGEFRMFIAYGTKDNFNGDDQARSFMFHACTKGITAEVFENPGGNHSKRTGYKFMGSYSEWISEVLAPYVPR